MQTINEDPFDDDLLDFGEEEPGEPAPPGGEPAGEGGGEPRGDGSGRLSIFISHRCVVEPDRGIAQRLYQDLSPFGDVYVNTAEPAGRRFDEEIKGSLDRADFVIALLSAHANESDWVRWELSYAASRWYTDRRPTIIPVLLGIDLKDLSSRIGASVSGFNPTSVNPGDYAGLLTRIQNAIENEPPQLDPSIIGLEGFQVGEFRKGLTRAATLDSPELRRAGDALRAERLFWVVGDAGVRNHFARTLAVKEHDRQAAARAKEKGPNVYEVTRALSWSRVDDTLVRDSVIVFTDVMPSALSDEEPSRDELKSLKRLAARNHVIVTASEESYAEIEQEMRDRELGGGARRDVGHDFYDERAKLEIFGRLLDFSHGSRDITRRQHQWARQLLEDAEGRETFRAVVRKWSPSDVERFVTRHLRQVRRQGDILRLLQRNADLDNEIHAWFVGLDDSTRCFVLALAMLPGLGREQLWEKYKLILERLRGLDAGLALWPLGICRQRAAPYVTTEGQLDFVDERITEAVQREVTINFREYLVELTPLIKELSVPPGREQRGAKEAPGDRRARAAERKEVRDALARLVGKAGRQGLQDFRGLIEFWGTDPSFQVREAVATSLEQAAKEGAGAKHALNLLERWCNVASSNQETFYRAAAAASALAAVVALRPAGDAYEKALALLLRLADGAQTGLRFYVSVALKKAVRRVPLDDGAARVTLATLLRSAARDGKASTKINVAEALNEARVADEPAALRVIREWATGDDADCRWVAMCSLFLWRRQRNEERVRGAVTFLGWDAHTAASVLVEVINHKHERTPVFWKSFSQTAREADEATRAALVSGLSALPQATVEETLLPLLRASGEPALSGLAADVRAERWRLMFPAPAEFVADLRRELQREGLSAEIYSALSALLRPEPRGRRGELVWALVRCFADCRPTLDEVLTRLKGIAPTLFEPLSVEVRREGLRPLLHSPPALVSAVAEGLGRAELARDTGEALAALAQPEPYGYRAELLRALAESQAADPAMVFGLLQQFRASGNAALGQLAYELNLAALEGDVADPGRFLSRVNEMLRFGPQRAEVFRALEYLSAPAPHGRRGALVRALGAARVTRAAEVDALLQDGEWQPSPGTFSLGTEVKLFSYVARVLSPGVAAAIFDLVS